MSDLEVKKQTESEEEAIKEAESSSSEDETSDDEDEFKKFEQENSMNKLLNYHPEIQQISYKELQALTKISRNDEGIIIDPLHTTLPILTRYEKARIIGLRAKQINDGSDPLVTVSQDMINGLTIAQLEFKQKKLPFIIRRPLPNGGSEYWNVHDLVDID